ncbi:YraN family protein [Leptospira langatensis]|uniref:UPF0102 protein EHO57_03900 n=1 Tax=Leptospira langatensis TaxID=2484983 RepID=A0A5F2A0J0_9LEPT|nr:YraN family protein [Leptospira langatensis]TGK04259.1 YraN family protein [Leptospira langatensis]TGL43739.1 YraN family protein [Leptospira langatensis]
MKKLQNNSKEKGNLGEELAQDYLTKNGHKILERNFRIRTAEIDIITLRENVLHFIEVKHWIQREEFHPLEVFTPQKMRKMRTAAKHYLEKDVSFRNYFVSFCLAFINEKRELTFYLNLF